MAWHPATRILLAVAIVAVPASLLLPEDEPAAVAARPAPTAASLADDPVPVPDAPAEPAVLAPLEALTDTIARPLFSPTRRPAPPPEPPPPEIVPPPPPEPVAVAPPTPPVPLTELVVSGIVVSPEGALVVLRPLGGGPSVIAREGDEVGGWRVERIEPTAVHLSSPDGTADHLLFAPGP